MSNRSSNTLNLFSPATVLAVAMFCFSSAALLLPASVLATLSNWLAFARPPVADISSSDKWVHGLIFTLCGYSVMRAWGFGARSWLWALCALVAYGAATEALQLLVPGRSASWGDWFADALGACIGVCLGFLRNLYQARAR